MSYPTAKLRDCARIVSGSTPKTNVDEYWDGDIWWVTPADISKLDGKYISSTPNTITQPGYDSCSTSLLPPNSVILSSRAPIGHVAINTVPMATNQGFKSFIPHDNKLDSLYLYYWLKANTSYLQSLGRGATFKEISKSIVEEIEIPLPPLAEQRRIAAILDCADTLRAKRRAGLAMLDALLQATFLDMFGEQHEQMMPIAEAMEVIIDYRGKTPPKSDSGVPLLTTKIVRDGYIERPNEFISSETYKEWMTRGMPQVGDVVFTTEGPLGKVAQIRDSNMALGQRLVLLRGIPELIDNKYLRYVLTTPLVKQQIEQRSTGSTVKGIRQKELRKVEIPIPPLEKQQQFTTIVSILEKQRDAYNSQLNLVNVLFHSLQQRAFRGELGGALPAVEDRKIVAPDREVYVADMEEARREQLRLFAD